MSSLKKSKIYMKLILPVVLYANEIWSLILRDRHEARGSDKNVLRKYIWTQGR